jgi:plasmid stability protein
MPQLLVRDVPPEIVDALKRRAASAGRSAEAEHRRILEEALKEPVRDFWEEAAELRAELAGRITDDSTDIIRADRDRDGP